VRRRIGHAQRDERARDGEVVGIVHHLCSQVVSFASAPFA
jgi:hypothetical protein